MTPILARHICAKCDYEHVAEPNNKRCPQCSSMEVDSFMDFKVLDGVHLRRIRTIQNYNEYEAVSPTPPDHSKLPVWQTHLGYDPRGYGDPFRPHTRGYNKLFITTWRSSSHAD